MIINDIMGVIIMELHNSWKWVVLTKSQLSCTIYTMRCNYATHATCLLAFTLYKCNELQVSSAIQKFNCKAS
jgi:hypothetical protein